MYCRNCAHELSNDAVVCVGCGLPPLKGDHYCQNCKAATDPKADVCIGCGVRLARAADGRRSRVVAGVLGITLGWLGIHRFYLGFNGLGLAHVALAALFFLTCGVSPLISWIWGLVDGIRFLTRSITTDADGNPLSD